jgi:signal transduction histidine kinase
MKAFDVQERTSSQLVEANEQLVLSGLRAQADAETAARDIAFRELATELRLESQRLGEENRQIKEASRLKSQFLANMSHELRTPLNAIIGFSALLRSGAVPEGSPKFATFLDHINTSGQHLLHLIEGILDFSKVTLGGLTLHPEPVDLPQVVAEVTDMLQAAASRKGVVVTVDLDPHLTGLVLDRTRLKQVLANYLSNAIKFSHEGGRVAVRAFAQSNGRFRVEVEDAGIGISVADQSRLFVEFHQVDSSGSRKNEGTGLGLAITRLLVEAQGGFVGVRSAPGKGSTFHIVLATNLAAKAPAVSP